MIQEQGFRPLVTRLGEVYQALELGIGTDGHMDAFLRGVWLYAMIPPVKGSSRKCDMRPEKGPKKIFVPLGEVVSQNG
jgi:hypothetical protein